MRSILRFTTVAATIASGFAAASANAAEYANVVSATPVIVSVAQPHQVCSDSQQLVQQRPSGAGAVIGAIAGGVLGNSIGGGFGRAAATGLGLVAGSVVGNQVESNATPLAEVPVRRCQTVTGYEQRTVGYDVTYDYAGRRYSTRMANYPGQQFAVTVQPADGSAPAPAYSGPVYSAPSSSGSNAQPVPLVGSETAVTPVAPAEPAYYDPLPRQVYYQQPVYYAQPAYAPPLIGVGIGFGYYGGYRGGYRHWR